MGRRALTTLALTGALLAVPASAAFAHECFVANRSANGSSNAAHSSNWFALSLADLFAFELGVPAENVDDAVAEAGAAGVPEAFAIFTRKTIGEGSNGRHADGKGLEHLSKSPIAGTVIEIASKWGGSAGA